MRDVTRPADGHSGSSKPFTATPGVEGHFAAAITFGLAAAAALWAAIAVAVYLAARWAL